MPNSWIGVDLDGTLCEYHGWVDGQTFGKPIPKMVDRVKYWLSTGVNVKIVTARAAHFHEPGGDEHKKQIEDWCEEHIGQVLPITNQKDFNMIELWDDRCKQVIPNTGVALEEIINPKAILKLKRIEKGIK